MGATARQNSNHVVLARIERHWDSQHASMLSFIHDGHVLFGRSHSLDVQEPSEDDESTPLDGDQDRGLCLGVQEVQTARLFIKLHDGQLKLSCLFILMHCCGSSPVVAKGAR
jgi:hypothetical protein